MRVRGWFFCALRRVQKEAEMRTVTWLLGNKQFLSLVHSSLTASISELPTLNNLID